MGAQEGMEFSRVIGRRKTSGGQPWNNFQRTNGLDGFHE